MAEPLTEGESLMSAEHEVQPLEQAEEKQAVMEVARLVSETEIEHGNASTECTSDGLEGGAESLETNPPPDVVQEVGRTHPGSDVAINIMSHMEISRLIANVVKRMQEESSQGGISPQSQFHIENLLKQIVTNQNTITINQNSLLRNQQTILQKVDMLNNLLLGALSDGDPRLADKILSGSKSTFRTSTPSPRQSTKRSYGMDGTAALVQAAEQVAMISGTSLAGTVAISVTPSLNGVTTTAVTSQDGGIEGEQRIAGDEEQPTFSTSPQSGTELAAISQQGIYLGAGSMSPEQILQQSKTGNINEITLIRLKARSQSVGNFAVHLVREMFEPHELLSKNVSGTRNKEKLDPEKVAKIRKYVFDLFPTSELDKDKVWSDCRKAIDEFLRRPNKRKNQGRLSHDGLTEYGMKKDKLSCASEGHV